MVQAFGARMAPGEGVRRVVESGRTGRKGRSGFYLYDADGKKGGVDESVYKLILPGSEGAPPERALEARDIVLRCVLAMVNEAALCLQEGILRSPRDGDIGAVFGLGFPPFRGGPFRYMDATGIDEILSDLDTLDGRFPERFKPAPIIVEIARNKSRFYPAEGRPV